MIDIRIALQPKQKVFLETIEKTQVTFYGGAKGGGKSKGLQLIMLLRRFKYPGSTGAIFRRSFPELEGNHIRPLFQAFPELREYWHESKKLLTFPNGSTLQFCHCNNETDTSLYQGREFHDLAIDEAGQWSEGMFRTLLQSNRSSKDGIRPRAILTGNPGGIGHSWLKRLFIERRFNDRERPEHYAFIQALVDDNSALVDNDPDYVSRLEAEPNEALRRAYRFGDWDIFAGQFFDEIRREKHLIKPFDIPKHWNRFGSYDYGYNHPASFGYFAVDEDGNVFLYRRIKRVKTRVDQFVKVLKQYPDTKSLYPVVAGHDCWTQRAVLRDAPQPPTIAEEFASYDESDPDDYSITLKRATIDRIQGASQLRSYLAWQGKPNKLPRLYIFDTPDCRSVFDCLGRMVNDPDRPEDVLKVDATEGDPETGDDDYDMTRYGVMTRPAITEPIKPKIPIGSPSWYQETTKIDWEKERERMIGDAGNWPEVPADPWGNL